MKRDKYMHDIISSIFIMGGISLIIIHSVSNATKLIPTEMKTGSNFIRDGNISIKNENKKRRRPS